MGNFQEVAVGTLTKDQDKQLEDPENWPDEDEQYMRLAQDLWFSYILAVMIVDKDKRSVPRRGQFDFAMTVEKIVIEYLAGKGEGRASRRIMLASRSDFAN